LWLTLSRFVVENWEVTNWFLDHGADPNATCYLDLTPLSFAIQRSSVRIINLLFERGGDITRGQLLHHAIERKEDTIEVLELLLQKGAMINARMYENHLPSWNFQCFKGIGTPLHKATELGKADVVSFLVQKGADPSIRDSKGRTVLDCARRFNQHEIIKLLDRTF
jgi:ankyrin repeat protein